MISLQS